MEPSIAGARESLRTVEDARWTVNRHSQNNGVILLVWGAAVLVGLAGFDILPWIVRGSDSGPFVLFWATMAPGLAMLPLVMAASAWTKHYLRRLPVEAGTPSNPWMFVPIRGRRKICFTRGWWSLYHVVVLLGGIAAGKAVAHAMHHVCLLRGTMTLIGLVDAAPLLITGALLWHRSQEHGRLA